MNWRGTNGFLPISRRDLEKHSWYYVDFVLITGDAYVDHPSFGAAIIGRILEKEGFRVGILSCLRKASMGFFDYSGQYSL